MLLEILLSLLLLLVLVAVVVAGVSIYMSMPLSDLLNATLRRIGLAGPSPESRTVGIHHLATVDETFEVRRGEEVGVGRVFVEGETWNAVCPAALTTTLAKGDTVEVIYNDDLTVTVVGKPKRGKRIHPSFTAGHTRRPR